MAVAIDNAGLSAVGTAISSLSITSFAVGAGANRLLFVGASQWCNPDRAPGGNFNTSETLTLHDAATIVESTGTRRASILRRIAPSNVSATVQVTWGGAVDEAVIGADSWTGVDQTTPLGTAVKFTSTNSAAPSVTVASATGNIVHDVLAADASASANAIIAGSGQTEDWDNFISSATEGGGSREAGAASVVMDWAYALGGFSALIAADIKQVSAVVAKLPSGLVTKQAVKRAATY